jgi:aspartate-semialdehyde dehydrogenase
MSEVVGVAGATGALGGELVKVLDQVKWRPDSLMPLARATSSTQFLDYGEDRVAVDNLEDADFAAMNLVFVAVPREFAADVVDQAVANGVPVVDCSGASIEDPEVPLVVPSVNPEALSVESAHAVLAIPSAPTLLLAGAIGAFQNAGLAAQYDATVMVSASHWGRAGMDELSRQVVTLFNSGTPPRKVFPEGLAFDLLPEVGELGADGWSAVEAQVSMEMERLFGDADVAATVVGVPLFSGIAATLHVRTKRSVPNELVIRLLADAGLQFGKVGRPTPRPRRVEGEPLVHVGRIRQDPRGDGFHLVLAADNLRAAASVAVACGAALLDKR